MLAPVRGFAKAEYYMRTQLAQTKMAKRGLSALLLTTEPEVRYYTGFLTRFWESPTRPWFVVVPAIGAPIAIIPSIGAHLMGQTWIKDIRTWQAPDYDNDGITLLAQTLREVTPSNGKIGLADEMESHVHMPLASLRAIEALLDGRVLIGDGGITRDLRLVKSEAEITKIHTAAKIADRAFNRVSEIACEGEPLSKIFRNFQALCLNEGADWVPYLAGAADRGGYNDVISPATDAPLLQGDVLMLDTGLIWDGYFCDFDRNFSVNKPNEVTQTAHSKLIDATQAAFELAKPGALISELFHTMNKVINPRGDTMEAGRLGHGLGMQLTEWPSIIARDHTVLFEGMVLTLEPSVNLMNGKILVHEENIVIRENGAEYLSEPQNDKMRIV
ncbi:MAG: Xaa-Pro peptidase family protein [Octadecabacter sp.]|nr:Xaa-Pro peptidase family protein [Octadecabacter sp.]